MKKPIVILLMILVVLFIIFLINVLSKENLNNKLTGNSVNVPLKNISNNTVKSKNIINITLKTANKTNNKTLNKKITPVSVPTSVKLNHTPDYSKKHNKVFFNNVLISFRIDKITFKKEQKESLNNALNLARLYNITFDLGVIAKSFSESADPETFKIFEENQDVFEIVANGYDSVKYKNNLSCTEFTCSPYSYQDEHIRKMKEIFYKYNLTDHAYQIFLVPSNLGDDNTVKSALNHNFEFLSINPNKLNKKNKNNSIVFNDIITINTKQTKTDYDVQKYKQSLYKIIGSGKKRIHIVMDLDYFNKTRSSDYFIDEIVNNNKYKSKIKFSMISDGL